MANKDNQKNSAEAYREERKARLAQSAKKNQKKNDKHQTAAKIAKRVVAIVLAVALALGIVWVVIDQTGAIKKANTVFSFGDIKISELEYTYYYSRQLSNIYYMLIIMHSTVWTWELIPQSRLMSRTTAQMKKATR